MCYQARHTPSEFVLHLLSECKSFCCSVRSVLLINIPAKSHPCHLLWRGRSEPGAASQLPGELGRGYLCTVGKAAPLRELLGRESNGQERAAKCFCNSWAALECSELGRGRRHPLRKLPKSHWTLPDAHREACVPQVRCPRRTRHSVPFSGAFWRCARL